MPDYKEMYLKLFRGIEQAKNIQIKAQQHCEEMYITAPESKLQLLPEQEDGTPQSQVIDTADWREMYHHLFQESHKAVAVIMEAQIECDAMVMNSTETRIMLLHSLDTSNLILDKDE